MKFVIQGGKPLIGEVALSGAKNAATKMMVASLLTDEPVTLENFPFIGDTELTGELCEHIGSILTKTESSLTLHTPEIKNPKVSELSRRNRIPILALGPLLARTGEAEVPVLGGDKIGPRPVDLHMEALQAMGAQIEATPDSYRARAKFGLKGAVVSLRFPSVGATENVILAAVLAEGLTVIKNAAMEPEVIDLIKMLQNMGAIIEMEADRTIYVEGVPKLHGVSHRVLPDRNEAVSFACLALATAGKILVKEANQDHMITFLNTVRRVGGDYSVSEQGITFWRGSAPLKALRVRTTPHPGFMTDWQQPLAVVLTQTQGDSRIHETIYEDRFGYAQDLNSMGANIEVFKNCGDGTQCRFSWQNFPHRAIVHGPTPLHGANLVVRDLRSGIAHIIAALAAMGESTIEGIEEIERGYVNIEGRLQHLGAEISKIE